MEVTEKSCEDKDVILPATKRQKHSLETRLTDILCCVVCLDLPASSVMQCPNGHLMCSSCHEHVLADAMLKDSTASCPSCRVDLNRHSCTRNLAVEKAVAELLTLCSACNQEMARSDLIEHQKKDCVKRTCKCRCEPIGCDWQGCWSKLQQHETTCEFLNKSPDNIIQCLETRKAAQVPDDLEQAKLLDLLNAEVVTYMDVHLRASYTEDSPPKLFYESGRFNTHSITWILKLFTKEDKENASRTLCYQLVCKQRLPNNLLTKFAIVSGPLNKSLINIKVNTFEFKTNELESSEYMLPLAAASDCNRFLTSKIISLRLIMTSRESNKT